MNRPSRGFNFRGVSFRGTAAKLGVPNLNLGRLRPKMRKRTLALVALLIAIGAAITGWTILRQTAILRQTLEAQLSQRFGAAVSIESVEWDGWSTLVATGLTLRVPGWPAPANEVASIRRAVVVFQPAGLLSGKLNLDDLEIDGLTLRIIERAETPGTFNLLAMKPALGDSGSMGQPRKAIMRDLRLELGVLRGEKVEIVAQRAFTGSFEHQPDDASLYSFTLSQTEEDGKAPEGAPVRIFGTWDERTFAYEASLDSLPIHARTTAMLPLQARIWARRAGLTGRIESARFSGDASNPLSFSEVRVKGVTFREREFVRTVPWARLNGTTVTPIRGDVTVHLPDGLITLRGNTLEVSATSANLLPGAPGSGAVEIPVELKLSMDIGGVGTRPFDWDATDQWLTETLAQAPFDLHVRLAGVSAMTQASGEPRPVELPETIIRTLSDFGATNWLADIDLRVSRARAMPAEDGTLMSAPVKVKGRMSLTEGSINYRDFPYAVNGVKGTLEFDGERVRIEGLSGKGDGGATLRVDGVVDAVGADPGYRVRVVGMDVPVDDHLLDCLGGESGRVLGAIFDRRAYASLAEAGLAGEASRPGGKLSFDIALVRARGAAARMSLVGTVDVADATVLLRSFPYPLRVRGPFTITDEAVLLAGAGIRAETVSGGQGLITGRIDMPWAVKTGQVETHIAFDFQNEHITPQLLAAIPPSFTGEAEAAVGWPGATKAPIAVLLDALGASGTLRVTGSVETQPDGEDRVAASAVISDGAIAPSEGLPRVLRKFNLSWPAQMALNDVNGAIELTSEGLEIIKLEARREEGRAIARGHFSADGSVGHLHIDMQGFPLMRDLIGVAEGSDLSTAYRAWDALQPTGAFDGMLDWRKDADSTSTDARVQLTRLVLAGGRELTPVKGEFTYSNGTVRVHDLELRAAATDPSNVVIKADGILVDKAPDFTATATGVTLGSSLVQAGLRAGGQDGVAEVIQEWQVDGSVDATLKVGAAAGAEPWVLSVSPSWITGVHSGQAFSLAVQSGTMEALDAGVMFNDIRAGVSDGWLGLRGSILVDQTGTTKGDLLLTTLLSSWSADVHALLPLAARAALEGIEFGADAPVSSDGLRIQFGIAPGVPNTLDVTGRLALANGHFKAGTEFTHADGQLVFALNTVEGRPSGHIGLEFMRLLVVEREATAVSARLKFNAQDNTVTLEDLEGSMYDGRVVGRAYAEMDERFTALISFANVRFAPFAEATDTPEEKLEAFRARQGRVGPGRMRGQLQLSGVFGQPELQRGTGRIAVADARMMEFPLGMSILQLSQLMLPINASLERADVEFEVLGDVLSFERFTLASSTLRLEGSGSLSLADGDLALRFRNRGTLPIWSDLFGAVVSDQMFMIDVGGTLKAPEPRLVPIPILAPEPSLPQPTHASRMTSKPVE